MVVKLLIQCGPPHGSGSVAFKAFKPKEVLGEGMRLPVFNPGRLLLQGSKRFSFFPP